MNTEVRFLLAIGLMLVVLVGTNLLFPPVPQEEVPGGEATAGQVDQGPASGEAASTGVLDAVAPEGGGEPAVLPSPQGEERLVTVESPLFRLTFSNVGAALVSAEMVRFEALNRDGLVDLVPEGAAGYLTQRLIVGSDTLDMSRVSFEVEPGDVTLSEGDGPKTLSFRYQHPTRDFGMELRYEFRPEAYQVVVHGEVRGLDRPLVLTSLGDGLAYAEADSVGEARAMAFVGNHVRDGIDSHPLNKAEPGVQEGPFIWTAFRSKFFVMALLAGDSEETSESEYLGGLLVSPSALDERIHVEASQTPGPDGVFGYRLFMGPQEYARLSSLGEDMEEVNPYGWRFFRPIVRPFVSLVTGILTFLHNQLNLGYGWVLILFGVMMRVLLWPLNQKAMRSQLQNMAVQPQLKEIQTKYKDNPEKLQKEMARLWKEEGYNPLGGCLPMLIPWPVLIALFFVFQNTIELRGVTFLWMPDLSAPDPLYILPLFLGLSMFLMQWFSMRALDEVNPQMKMMMWIMPIMMVFIFFRLASGLNLYYAVSNIATIPQQVWINKERRKMKGQMKTAGAKAGAKG